MEQVSSLRTEDKFKKTELGEIPVEWEIATLGDISVEIYRYPTYYNIQYVEKGIPEIRGELIKSNGTLETDMSLYRFISKETAADFPRTRLQEGDFVISVRGTMGKVAIVPKELDGANITANLMRISPDTNRVYPLWLHQIFMSERFQEQLNTASSSTTIKTIKAPELKSFKFAVPTLSEQKKIAHILSTIDSAFEKSDKVIEKTKELKKGLMQELLTRGIGHKRFKKTKIGEIPEEWGVVTLNDVAAKQKHAFVDGPFGSNLKTIHYVKEGVPVIQSQFIISGKFEPSGEFYISKEKAKELERSNVVAGDIAIAKIGVNYGASATIPEGYPESVLSGNTMKITPDRDKVNTEFLQYIFHYLRMIKKFDEIVTTTAQPAITLRDIKNIKISLPSLPEQKKIAAILSSVDEKIEKEVVHKEKLENIKKGLMQVLLTGKIRVK